MCVVKDEADVIAQTLERAAQWCDHIYVYDNGSSDGTWEIVRDLARARERIVPFKTDGRVFVEGIRREVFAHYRRRAAPGDWWCRLDSDEVYVDDPRDFLARVPKEYEVVWGAMLNYYFTDRDLARYEADPSAYGDGVPFEGRYRYYRNGWSEPRLFRESRHLFWPSWRAWPILGATHPRRLRIKHFQYRSPESIQKRIVVRRENAARGGFAFPHEILGGWTRVLTDSTRFLDPAVHDRARRDLEKLGPPTGEEWRERIVDASTLDFDAQDGTYVMHEDLMPPLPKVGRGKLLVKRCVGRTLNVLLG